MSPSVYIYSVTRHLEELCGKSSFALRKGTLTFWDLRGVKGDGKGCGRDVEGSLMGGRLHQRVTYTVFDSGGHFEILTNPKFLH